MSTSHVDQDWGDHPNWEAIDSRGNLTRVVEMKGFSRR
jgi:hypothetical protein